MNVKTKLFTLRSLPGLLLLYCLLAACTQLKPEQPVQQASDTEPVPALSYLSAPIIFEMQDLENKINEQLKPVIINDDSYENNHQDNLRLRVVRTGPVEIQLSGNLLQYSLPLKVSVAKRLQKRAMGLEIQKEKALDFALRASFSSVVNLGSDWRLHTKTRLRQIEWIQKPVLKVGPLKIGLAALIEKELSKKAGEIEDKIDALAHEKLRLEQKALKIWQDLQKPILINKKHHKIWLQGRPVEFMASQLSGNRRFMIINTRMSLYIGTLLGENPVYEVSGKLPPLKLMSNMDSSCRLFILSKFYYEDINKMLNEKLAGTQLSVEEHHIKINRLSTYCSGRDLIVRVDIKGDVKGSVFFRGRPHYDATQQQITVLNFDFDVKSEESLVHMADWLLHDTFRQKVQQVLQLPLKPHIEKIPQLVEAGIEKGKVGERISVHLSEVDVQAKEIAVCSDAIAVVIAMNGKAVLRMDKL